MREVNVTEFRNHLPHYLSAVREGAELFITSHGSVIARLSPPTDKKIEAKKFLKSLQKKCSVADVFSPLGEKWEVDQ